MANVLHVTAENPDELLNAGMYGAGAIIRLQSGSAEAGPFANEATSTLVAGTRSYILYDADGGSTTWYRSRYENAAGTSVSEWSAAFQAGDEQEGQICSIYDVEQRLSGAAGVNDRELLLEFIRDATVDIEGYCERWFVPRPLSGTTTILLTPTRTGNSIRFPKGIRSVSAIGYATTDQPDTGGTYTAITASNVVLLPGTHDRNPLFPAATEIRLLSTAGALFYGDVLNGVQVTGALGCAAVPATIAGIGATAVIKRFQARGAGYARAAGTDDFAARLLRWISPEERETLDRIRVIPV